MKQQLIKQISSEILETEKKKKLAAARLKAKRTELQKEVLDDTPDLFGQRKTASEAKLFDERANAQAIDKALEPFRAEITSYDKQLQKLRTELVRAENMRDTDLFSSQAAA